jgi:hypothetical protein
MQMLLMDGRTMRRPQVRETSRLFDVADGVAREVEIA